MYFNMTLISISVQGVLWMVPKFCTESALEGPKVITTKSN